MANIGEPERRIDAEPLAPPIPITPAPTPAEPAREPVPA